jgi:hypothetical protein
MGPYWTAAEDPGRIIGTGPTPPAYTGQLIRMDTDPPSVWHVRRYREWWLPPVPDITGVQLELALLNAGLLSQVDAIIAAIPDPTTKRATEIAFKRATRIGRNDPLILQFAGPLGLTSDQLDIMFRQAALL